MVLDELPPTPDLWMLAIGTGVDPFIAILNSSELWQQFKQVVLVHAVSTADELTYSDSVNEMLQRHPKTFHYVPFVSRKETANTIHGRIPDAINNGQLESTTSLSLTTERSHVMLCGNAGMIKDASELLEKKGMRRHRRSARGISALRNIIRAVCYPDNNNTAVTNHALPGKTRFISAMQPQIYRSYPSCRHHQHNLHKGHAKQWPSIKHFLRVWEENPPISRFIASFTTRPMQTPG